MSIELVHKGYEIHFENISYSVPRLKQFGFRNDLEAKRCIDQHLRKVARRERDQAKRDLGLKRAPGGAFGGWE